jgi:hypothetical protein
LELSLAVELLTNAPLHIGLGAVAGAGAVSFVERLLSQRRESTTNKAQITLRRVCDRKNLFQVEERARGYKAT